MPALSPSFLGVNSANVFYPLLLALVLLVSLHDLRRGRIPNWVTLPLLGIGLLWNFPSFLRAGPGALETWLACLLLFAAWRAGWLGGGDAKLWIALLWLAPAAQAQTTALVMSGAFVLTALAQLLWRKFNNLWHSCQAPLTGTTNATLTTNVSTELDTSVSTGLNTSATLVKTPGAWRTIPYAIWLCTLPISGWLF
ncbi:MAG: A24 family peptidase [Anaerolineales bacterium]|nr:A24 family peptidase [Anaerolineales bacterium]